MPDPEVVRNCKLFLLLVCYHYEQMMPTAYSINNMVRAYCVCVLVIILRIGTDVKFV